MMKTRLLAALLFCVAWASAANAAPPAIDGSSTWTTVASGTTITSTLTTTSTNDVIIIYVQSDKSVSSVADTAGLTWQQRAQVTNGTTHIAEWYASSAAVLTGDVITVTLSAATAGTGTASFGVSGGDTVSPFDPAVVGSQPTGTGTGAVSISTLKASDLILGFYKFNITSPTAGTGFTAVISPVGIASLIESKQVSAAQSNLSVAIGTGASNVTAAIADAIVDPTVNNAENASKATSYSVLNYGNTNSISATKTVSYIVLQQQTGGLWFHGFP